MTKKSEVKTWTSPTLRHCVSRNALTLQGDAILCTDKRGTGAHLNIPRREDYRYWIELSTARSEDAIPVYYEPGQNGRLPGGPVEAIYDTLDRLALQHGIEHGRRYWMRILYQHSPMPQVPEAKEWLRADEELPETSTNVLVRCGGRYLLAFLRHDGTWADQNSGNTLTDIKYWMPLPQWYNPEGH